MANVMIGEETGVMGTRNTKDQKLGRGGEGFLEADSEEI